MPGAGCTGTGLSRPDEYDELRPATENSKGNFGRDTEAIATRGGFRVVASIEIALGCLFYDGVSDPPAPR